jgi:hypothetical protein
VIFKSFKRARMIGRLIVVSATLALAGCGTSTDPSANQTHSADANADTSATSTVPQSHPQVIQPTAGVQAGTQGGATVTPVGDPNAHAPPLAQVKHLLHLEVIAAPVTSASYIDPLQFVSVWERTDQGVDAQLPIGAPILAPGRVKILAIIPNWYAGQPLVYFELLDGPDAGRVQYVAEQITDIARPGSILDQGQVIARYAKSGTAIEYGWSTLNGITLARATTGYEEGEITPAGRSMRAWLNSLGANAGPNF